MWVINCVKLKSNEGDLCVDGKAAIKKGGAVEENVIKGFGRDSSTDYSMLINIVYVLIGFMISTSEGFLTGRQEGLKAQLISIQLDSFSNAYTSLEGLVYYGSSIAEAWMFLIGSIFLICFLFYLAEYYEKIWVELFIQQKDKVFFRFYCIFIGFYVILLKLFPVVWPVLFSVLFLILMHKKWSTRREIRAAIDAIDEAARSKRVKAIYALADTMAYNFSVLGGICLIFLVAMTYVAFYLHQLWALILASLFSALLCYFWLRKVQSGIDTIRSCVEAGNISDAAFVRVIS